MNSEDRELLELAAKAASLEGFAWVSDPFFEGLERRNFEGDGSELQSQTWNPLVSDRDALRLAVNLRLYVSPNISGELAMVFADISSKTKTIFEPYGSDPCAATRRAIVRAAAEIGRGMP